MKPYNCELPLPGGNPSVHVMSQQGHSEYVVSRAPIRFPYCPSDSARSPQTSNQKENRILLKLRFEMYIETRT